MRKRDYQQELLGKAKRENSPFAALDFFVRSTFLAIALTFLPVALLVGIWELGLTTPTVMIAWVMLALFWTFFVLLKLSQRFVD